MSVTKTQRLPRSRYGNPILRSTSDVLDYWAERIAEVAPARDHFSKNSMVCESDSLYHYGHHFELARIIRDKRGRTRLVLLNGDTYEGASGFGPSTSSRQDDVRRVVARTGAPSVVVPFSALDGAGIDIETVMPIHVRADRTTIEEHSSRSRPAKLARMPDPSGAMTTETYWHYTGAPDYRSEEREREIPVYVDNPNQTVPFRAQHGWCNDGAQRDEEGLWRWQVQRHWLGDSIFRARSTERRTRRATADELAARDAHLAWEREMARLREASQRFSWRPWERRAGSRDYRRMFRRAWAQASISEAIDRHSARQPARTNVNRDGRVPITVTRWATFLSSFDYQESRPLYFLCELPHGAKPGTVDEAIEALKPPEVVAALARGLKVVRQGDLFAIPTKLTKRQIRRMRGREDFTKRLRVLGTNHSVTEGIVLKGGAVLGRGIMRHEPEAWRPPDHARQKLGDSWHLLVRNTVPRTR